MKSLKKEEEKKNDEETTKSHNSNRIAYGKLEAIEKKNETNEKENT